MVQLRLCKSAPSDYVSWPIDLVILFGPYLLFYLAGLFWLPPEADPDMWFVVRQSLEMLISVWVTEGQAERVG